MTKKKITYRVARTREELEEAYALVYKEYASHGYIPKGYKSKLRLTLLNALPTTTTLIAIQGKKVVATLTLIPDTPLGATMDKVFKDELDVFRKQGRYISECSQLAIDSSLFPKGFFSMFNFNKFIFIFKLFNLLFHYATYKDGLQDFCIAFNPRHQYLYRYIGFKQIGKLKYYGSYHSPAIAMRLDLVNFKKVSANKQGLYKVFFGSMLDERTFKNKYKLKPKDLEYFFVKKSNFFKDASEKEVAYIKSCYPKHKKELEAIFEKAMG